MMGETKTKKQCAAATLTSQAVTKCSHDSFRDVQYVMFKQTQQLFCLGLSVG
jgi:hypothetical protein